jgi:hypothetical protein
MPVPDISNTDTTDEVKIFFPAASNNSAAFCFHDLHASGVAEVWAT